LRSAAPTAAIPWPGGDPKSRDFNGDLQRILFGHALRLVDAFVDDIDSADVLEEIADARHAAVLDQSDLYR